MYSWDSNTHVTIYKATREVFCYKTWGQQGALCIQWYRLLKKILMPNLQKIFLPFTKLTMPSIKNINAFYVSNMPSWCTKPKFARWLKQFILLSVVH
jgi:hypothetical protein